MNLRQYIQLANAGMALPLGFASNNEGRDFITELGEKGAECTLVSDKSTFEVRTNPVKRVDSPAFGKLVGNVHVTLRNGTKEASVFVDFGTLHALVVGGGKAVLKCKQVLNSDGTPYTTRTGNPIFNCVADKLASVSPETLGETLEAIQNFCMPVKAVA